jgi:thioredoxin reductase/NAD-dependent dihydropyrimidine dehydrogenase PreA subunit
MHQVDIIAGSQYVLETSVYLFAALITALFPTLYLLNYRRSKKSAAKKREDAISRGLTEPASLHPVIDPTRCIGTAACVPVCPEGHIIGIIEGRAELVSPTKCIGHGACEASCPVEAISLVFGSERRGVELPYVNERFETNVPGIYIAGELGGMGLIRNAITQGSSAVDYIKESLGGKRDNGVLDLVIVGAGPAGISASLEAIKHGLKFRTLEQDDVGGTVLSYPRQKLVMTQPMEIPLYGKVKFREILKEELIDLWTDVTRKSGLEVTTGEKVESIENDGKLFRVHASNVEYSCRRVLLTIGRRGTPRKLGVPGERSSKVAYKLLEPEQYKGKHVLVVGGGDSAIEAAVSLAEQKGTVVTLSYRKDVFSRLKEKNEQRIEEAMRTDRVHVLFESSVQEVRREDVKLEYDGQKYKLRNDYLFVFIGGEMPTEFLRQAGISIVKKFGER